MCLLSLRVALFHEAEPHIARTLFSLLFAQQRQAIVELLDSSNKIFLLGPERRNEEVNRTVENIAQSEPKLPW